LRPFFLLLILASLFCLAWVWQTGTVRGLRRARAATTGVARGGSEDPEFPILAEGWGVVVVGDPSGADPVEPPRAPAAAPPPAQEPVTQEPAAAGPAWLALESRALGDYRLVVRRGQTLSTIAVEYYGALQEGLVAALARYNRLESADALAEGQTLLLPERAKLGLDGTPR